MKAGEIAILVILCCITIIMLVFYTKQKHPVKSALFGTTSGILGFVTEKFIFGAMGILFPLNIFTFWTSAVLGIPGVLALSVLQIL